MKRLLIILALGLCVPAFGQPGVDEMNQASQQLTSSFFSAFDCSLVIAAIMGLTGAVRIYHNWQMGKREMTADVAAWFFAAIFMVLAGAFLRALFGI